MAGCGLIATNSPAFKARCERLSGRGWRVEWDAKRRSNVCYRPDGEVAFEYGKTPEERDGAWAYLIHQQADDNA